MLKNLSIKNYAIIDNLSIDFDKGFNVFTGETGAGKSIIVGALSYLLKGRSDTSIIKTGKDKAIIEGVFEISDSNFINKLNEQGIDTDGEIIVKRIISSDNHNSIKINESNVTLNFLTDLFSDIIDIHSQKDNHFLFNKKNQLSLLDRYVDDTKLFDSYDYAFSNYIDLKNEYEQLENNVYNASEIEYLKFDFNELNDANLSLDEELELEEKEKRYKSSEKYIQSLQDAINYYDSNYGVKENLYNLFNSLNVDDDQINKISSDIKDIYYDLDEKVNSLKDILSSFNDVDINVEALEERLYLYSKLKRKHKTDTEGLISLLNELKNKISSFEDRDRVLADKKTEMNEAFKNVTLIASAISEKRKKAADELSRFVINECNDLLLNNIKFVVDFKEIECNSTGKDDIEFLVSLNKGEEVKPLRQIASGGEISRLMLGLKVVFAKLSNTDLLILDEIDSGVSGKVALAVGKKISKISKDIQVLCISHLAPVASCANNHYLIYKEDNDTSTFTNVRKLERSEIIEQLAIISNTSTDIKALEAAEELYSSSQKYINENN